jgi:aspartate/methionine/tyrosine aminotransferase
MIRPAGRIEGVEEYYFSKKLAEVRSLDTPELPVINLGIGSPDMPPSPDVIDALSAAAARPDSHGYQNYRGVPALRKAIAAFCHTIYSVQPDPEREILPLMGSKEGILHITMAFVNPGDRVLVPDPGYPTYSSAAKIAEAEVVAYPISEKEGEAIDMDSLERTDFSGVKLMWINFPHMPTGKTATADELKRLVGLAKSKGFLLVNDNPYSLILNDHPRSLLAVPGSTGTVLELNSLSKSHNMPGWRVGWVAGDQHLIDLVLRVKSNMDSGMFLGIQEAAARALSAPREWYTRINLEYGIRRKAVFRLLDRLGCTYETNQSGLFVWAKSPASVADVEHWLDGVLRRIHVFITPGIVFGSRGKSHVRVSLCNPVGKIEAATQRISHMMEEAEHRIEKESIR